MEQRIDGFKQIKAFYSWVFNNPDKARPTHVSLYLFLVNQNNRANWVEWFKCPYDLAMQGACIGNNGTYYKCLDELKEWELIDYQKGINNFKAPLVKLILLYKNEQLSEHVTVPLSEQASEQLSEQQYEQLPVHIYKLITNNIELITLNFDKIEDFIFSLQEKTTPQKLSLEEKKEILRERYKNGLALEINNLYPSPTEEEKKDIKDFIAYWCEPSKSLHKMKFEMEKTWDTNLRLKKWFSNKEKFAQKSFNKNPW